MPNLPSLATAHAQDYLRVDQKRGHHRRKEQQQEHQAAQRNGKLSTIDAATRAAISPFNCGDNFVEVVDDDGNDSSSIATASASASASTSTSATATATMNSLQSSDETKAEPVSIAKHGISRCRY